MLESNTLISPAQVEQARAMLSHIKGGAEQAIRSAINDVLRSERTDITRKIREHMNLPYRAVQERIAITGRPSRDSLTGKIRISYKPVPLREFSPKPRATKRGGVTASPLKGSSPLQFRHAFKAKMKSGHIGFFLRAKLPVFGAGTTAKDLESMGFPSWEARQIVQGGGQTGRGIRRQRRAAAGGNFPRVTPQGFAWRLPIAQLMGPAVSTTLQTKPGLLDDVLANAADKLQKRLASKIDWLLSRRPVPN